MAEIVAPSSERTLFFPRFGECTFSETEIISFPWGLPGFPDCRTFLPLTAPGSENVVWLQSLDDVAVAIPVADPWLFFPDYDPRLPAFARVSLALERPEDFTLLCVVVIPHGAAATMNLLAPVVVNLRTRTARQVTVEGGDFGMRVPLPPVTLYSPATGGASEPTEGATQ